MAPVRQALIVALMLGLVSAVATGGPLRRSRSALAALAVLGSFALSAALAEHPATSFERMRFVPIALLVMVAHGVVEPRRLMALVGTAASFVIVALAADALAQHALGRSLVSGTPPLGSRARAALWHPNDLAMLPLLLPLGLLALQRTGAGLERAARVALCVVCGAGVALSLSRNALLGYGLVLILQSGRVARWVVLATLALALATLGSLESLGWSARLEQLLDPVSTDGRFAVWLVGWTSFLDAPLVGIGPGMFDGAYADALKRDAFPAWIQVIERGWMPWAHNVYLEALCERGLVGFGIWVALLVCVGKELWPSVRDGSSQARLVATSLAAFLAMGLFDLTYLKDWVCLIFFLTCGLAGVAGSPPGERNRQNGERGEQG